MKASKVAGILFFLFLGDLLASSIASELAKNVELKSTSNTVDWHNNGVQNCEKRRMLILYRYQTCYVVYSRSADRSNWSAIFMYHRPRPLFHFSRLFASSDYYFREMNQGESLGAIHYSSRHQL